jgi:hypothetical protein
MITPANKPAFYFPLRNDIFEIKPGLSSLDADFGNGPQDQNHFQFDNQFPAYRNNKLEARNESLDKYFCLVTGKKLSTINAFIINTLLREYPEYFSFAKHAQLLDCKLTGEQLVFNKEFALNFTQSHTNISTPYINSLDALAMQVPEDIAIIEVNESGQDQVIALHLCAPNHWAAHDKIGQNFINVHKPVPGMERINQRIKAINLACLNKGPFVRFAWGLSTDKHLNHHPQAPEHIDPEQWSGRQFKPDNPQLYLRIERQTLTGFPGNRYVLFTIRTYFYSAEDLDQSQKKHLINTLSSMSAASLRYKGLSESKNNILVWLKQQG